MKHLRSISCILLLAAVFAHRPSHAAPGDITTFAGNNVGDGGSATTASIAYPIGVAVDSLGNLYIASNHRIRKVATSGMISTVAGNGIDGYSGDGGQATSASLNYPYGVALDSSGNIYIADSHNNRIRKVDTSGVISTVAGNGTAGYSGDGGPATSASLYSPSSVAVDTAGNIYIADSDNNRIRKVDTSGVISTVAGNGIYSYSGDGGSATSASMKYPTSVAVDAAGNIYIADSNNNRIRKVATSGMISTVAGNGTGGYSGDGGLATSANLRAPWGVAVDDLGNIYIADTANKRIRKVNTAGIISTMAGNGTAGYSGDGGPATSATLDNAGAVAVDSIGNVYIADNNNHRIRKVNTAGIISSVAGNGYLSYSGDNGPATSAILFKPHDIAIDSTGNVYIADYSNSRVRKVDASGTITTVAGNGTAGYSGDGGPATSATLNVPSGIAVDTAGNIYIADYYNNRIRKINTAGVISTVAGNGTSGYSGDGGQATSAKLYWPSGVAVDSAGNIFIADKYNHRIRKVDTTGVISTVAGNGGYGYWDSSDGIATSSRLYYPTGVAVDAMGNIYIADTNNHRICKVNTSGIISTVAGNVIQGYSGDGGLATSASLSAPFGVTLDVTGNIYIADSFNNRIRKVNTAGVIRTVAGNGTQGYSGDGGPATSAGLYRPNGLEVDSASNVYIADTYNDRIRKVEPAADIASPTGSASINSGAAYTNSTSVTLTLSCNDIESGCAQMQLSNDNTNWTTAEAYATSKAWTLASGDGMKTVYVKFKDTAGNWSSGYNDTIILDITAPNNGSLSAIGGSGQVSLSWSGFSDSPSGINSYKVVYSTSSTPSSCSNGTQIYSSTGTLYTHASLSSGTTYYYCICAVDNAGNSSTGATASATTQTSDTTSPATSASPAGGTYTSSRSVTVTCSDGTGSGCSKIYYTTDGSTPTTSSTVYSAPISITKDTTLKFFAVDNAGNAGTANTETYVITAITAVDTTPPANPSNLNAASNSDGSITLSWTAPSDADLSGYNVYRDGTKINSSLVKTSSYKDINTVNGTSYSYRITSLDLAGNESSGITKTATSTVQANIPPSAPSNVKVEDTGTGYSLKVVWTANTETDLAGYKVYWGTASGTYANSQTAGNATSYTITGLTEGAKYYIAVTAYDTDGNESAKSIEVTGTPKAYVSRPDPATGLTVTSGNKYLTLSWTGVSNITGYMVYIGEADGVYGTPVRTASTTHTFQNLENNKTYYVAVSSYDLNSGSRYTISSESERTISSGTPNDNDAPAAPSSLTATDAGTGGKVALKWTREESFDISGYVVAYKETGNTVFEGIASTEVTWNYVVTGLTNGSSYTFYVYAYDANGNFSDPSSVMAMPTNSGSTADVTPPGVPILSAAPGNGKVTLMVTPPSDADIDHYNLYVYNLAAGKYMPLTSMNGLSYEHSTGVDNGKALVFVGTAVDAAGNESGYSITASAVPSELPGDIPLEEDPPVLDRVDGYDVNEIAKGFGSNIGKPNYNANSDLDGNGTVDGNDLLILGTNHGKKK